MHTADPFHAARTMPSQSPVEDAFTSWSLANRRCAEALRAWATAAASDREDAYRAYLQRLDNEEAAADLLAELHTWYARSRPTDAHPDS
jgi:hypothetical protein